MKQKILFWLALLCAIVFATYFAVRTVITINGAGSVFDVRRISVFSDNGKIDQSQVMGVLGIQPGTNSFDIDLDSLLARVMTIPELENAAVRRLSNGNLVVRLKTRTAIATWTDGTSFFPVAADGTIINRPADSRPEKTVVFRGNLPSDISEITKAIMHEPKIAENMDYAQMVENRRWNIVMMDGKIIKLPEVGGTEMIAVASNLDKKTSVLSREITELDMRDKDRVMVKVKK